MDFSHPKIANTNGMFAKEAASTIQRGQKYRDGIMLQGFFLFHFFLGGGFKYVLFSPRTLGKIPEYFSDGLVQPPTSFNLP